jgi:hypothetical protein
VRTAAYEFRGNVLNGGRSVAGGTCDRTNNVEQVLWQVPATGLVEISVRPHVVPVPTQDFALVVTADFEAWPAGRDDDGDSLPDQWELARTGSLSTGAEDDPDADGMNQYAEFTAGTDPADARDALRASLNGRNGTNGLVIAWPSVRDRFYLLSIRTDLTAGAWSVIASNVSATAPLNVTTVQALEAQGFYRIAVER